MDNEYLKNAKVDKNYIGYGIENNKNNEMKIEKISYSNTGMEFDIKIGKDTYTFSSKLLGEHNLINLFGAITISKELNIGIKEIINSVKHIERSRT